MKSALRLYGAVIAAVMVFLGCSDQNPTVIKVNNITVSSQEFEQAFGRSRFVDMGKQGRELFLDDFIKRKLILLEAESKKLDKDPEFLEDVQILWEQQLLKRVLADKSEELKNMVVVTDKEIENYYEENKSFLYSDKSLEEVSNQIRRILVNVKDNEILAQWLEKLKSDSAIDVEYSKIGLDPQ